MSLRILTITNWYPPHHRGGYEANCADVMTRLADRGHRVEILCGTDRIPGIPDGPEPVTVHRRIRMYWKDEAPWKPPLREQIAIERSNQDELLRCLQDLEPEVVSVWHMAAFSLNLLTTVARRGIPIVYAICDSWPSYTLSMDPWARRFHGRVRAPVGSIAERLLRIPSVVPDLGAIGRACFVSRLTRDGIRVNSPWRFREDTLIASGIDRSKLRAGIPEDRNQADRPWRWQLAYLGRFDSRKGTDTLVRALAYLPQATLTMFGRGGDAERGRLERLADEIGVRDRLRFGMLDQHQLGPAYRAADCVVFPSEWPEPFGLVPLEAMECRTPVVATGVGGSADFLVDGENCLLFEPGDPRSLAAAVQRLAEEGALRERLSQGGAQTAAEYDVERMADAYERQFLDAVSVGARRPALS